ncbi:Mitotic spindle checkpoint protein BUBR1 [Gracilariopsis chorda]|uniref:Mitotic spindle checkpoint protein BUBR1 n=1 Tax=Gracilariopsis chorda TaxID=448386 RepID=A0A2V3IHC4_9FLOR|nr:Mitotic spindle checkpoint protein BUBR1 [Gracilariopsis chorda]|eukprot:PXF41423.1 Mitotic spindle checkpoint protein BUBR1 [Gracilariopsis chorda]
MSAPVWETHKENIQPLRRGRHTKLLEKALIGSKQDIDAERLHREDAIKRAVQDNAAPQQILDAYLEAAFFISDHYPAGSKHLVSVVEDGCRKYAKDDRFRDDIRFVRLWVLYAEMRSDKLDVFSYMKRRRIGQSWTLFYEAYAATLEAARQYERAEDILALGKQVNAQPQERLQRRVREFQNRMAARARREQKKKEDAEARKNDDAKREAARMQRNTIRAEPSLASSILSQQNAEGNQASTAKNQRVRPALGEISERQAKSGIRPFSSQPVHPASSSRTPLQSVQLNHDASQGGANKFEIYSDSVEPSSRSEPQDDEDKLSFAALGKLDDVVKEDHGRLPSKWAGHTLPQNQAVVQKLQKRALSSGQMSSRFTIFQDENYQRGAYSPAGSPSHQIPALPEHAEERNNAENVNAPSPELSRGDPIPQQADRFNRPPSPTINTKIAMREIDDMFNSSLPLQQVNLKVPSTLNPARAERPDVQSFNVFNDENTAQNTTTGGEPKTSDEPVKDMRKRVLQPLDLHHSAAEPATSSTSLAPTSENQSNLNQQSQSRTEEHHGEMLPRSDTTYSETELSEFFRAWVIEQPSYQYIGSTKVDIEPDTIVELPWRVPLTFCVDPSQSAGRCGRSTVFFVEDMENELGVSGATMPGTHDEDEIPLLVLKQSSPPNVWEYYIYQTIQKRLRKKLIQTDSIPLALGFSQGKRSSFLVLDTKGINSLSDIMPHVPDRVIPEAVAMLFTVDLLKTLCILHGIGIIHSDVTLENVLFRWNTAIELTAEAYCPSGDEGWSACGILLVDFNNSIDAQHERFEGSGIEAVVQHSSTVDPSFIDQQYREANSKSWGFSADCFGAAVCASKMLGVTTQNLVCGPVALRHSEVWKNFFDDALQLGQLATPNETIAMMRRNCEAMERILANNTHLGFVVRKLYRVISSLEIDTTRVMKGI